MGNNLHETNAHRRRRAGRWLVTVVVPAGLGLLLAVLLAGTSGAPARQEPRLAAQALPIADGQASGAGLPQGTIPPPRFSAAAQGSAVQVDPAAADYDPLRLMPFATVSDIFAAEPRHAAWAPKVEGWLSERVRADIEKLVPGARELTVECRTTICKLHWRCQVRVCGAVRDVINGLYAGAAGSATKPNEVFLVYGGGKFFVDVIRRPDELLARLEAKRREALETLRRGAAPASYYENIPAHGWTLR